jgi:GTP-binding protein YchF
MSLSIGIVGLPNVGKSTLFNALTHAGAHVAKYPFTTIEPNVGVVPVPDERLEHIAAIVQPEKATPTTIEFVDIAGLVRGASKGEGLGNQFLGHIRNVDAIALVVRYFSDPDVAHVEGTSEARRDVATIHTELALADLATLEKRAEKIRQAARSGDKAAQAELALVERMMPHLNQGHPARTLALHLEEAEIARSWNLLTAKPILYVANVGECATASSEWQIALAEIEAIARAEGAQAITICARLEDELAELSPEDAVVYLADLGLSQAGLLRLIQASYRLLHLVTFFTATGKKEVRAWTVVQGSKAPQAAGKVHTDMERGFIRAEVISFPELLAAGSFHVAHEKGLVRLEGRDYVVQDGDIIHFRFSPP